MIHTLDRSSPCSERCGAGAPHATAITADVERVEGNGRDTGYGLEMIDAWLEDGPWDVIHFNWGLWDLCWRAPREGAPLFRDKVNGTLTRTPAGAPSMRSRRSPYQRLRDCWGSMSTATTRFFIAVYATARWAAR